MAHSKDVERLLYERMADRPDAVVEIAIAARAVVQKLAPGCSELLYQSYAVSDVFSFTHQLGQAFIHIATYANHVNLGFNRGALLKDEKGLLKGSGKLIRHIRLETQSTVKSAGVKRLIQLAIDEGRDAAQKRGGLKPATFIDKSAA